MLANLTAPLLTTHADGLVALLAPAGALVLSGLLDTDLDEVRSAYNACGTAELLEDGEWAALIYGGSS